MNFLGSEIGRKECAEMRTQVTYTLIRDIRDLGWPTGYDLRLFG